MDQQKRRTHRQKFVSGVFANEAVVQIGMARGVATSLAVTALVFSTATEEAERDEMLDEFLDLRAAYSQYIAEFLDEIEALPKPPADAVQTVKTYVKQLNFLGEDAAKLRRRTAVELAHAARNDVLPAMSAIIRHFQNVEAEKNRQRDAEIKARAGVLNKTFAEMDRIDRMIRLVSINASVEAARAGGEAGRTFQVIAEEVRNLAQRSAEMLMQVKDKTQVDAHRTDAEGRMPAQPPRAPRPTTSPPPAAA